MESSLLPGHLPGGAKVSPCDPWHRPGEVSFCGAPRSILGPTHHLREKAWVLSSPHPRSSDELVNSSPSLSREVWAQFCKLFIWPLSGESGPQVQGQWLPCCPSLCPIPLCTGQRGALPVVGRWSPCRWFSSSAPYAGLAAPHLAYPPGRASPTLWALPRTLRA